MKGFFANLHYWLVDHPAVRDFECKPAETFGGSIRFVVTSVITYLSLTAIIHYYITSSKSPPQIPSRSNRGVLRFISAVHSFILMVLSFVMAVGCILSTLSQMENIPWIFCFPANKTTPKGPVFFWAYIFYLSKIVEFVDTLLILLNNAVGGGKNRRLSFLHVYHHAVVVVLCYMSVRTSQSLIAVGVITNSSVHVIMYAYYMLCSLGRRPSWKKRVTDIQIIQFQFSFGCLGVMLWFHLMGGGEGGGCSGFRGSGFGFLFSASLLLLFTDFHNKNYDKKKLN